MRARTPPFAFFPRFAIFAMVVRQYLPLFFIRLLFYYISLCWRSPNERSLNCIDTKRTTQHNTTQRRTTLCCHGCSVVRLFRCTVVLFWWVVSATDNGNNHEPNATNTEFNNCISRCAGSVYASVSVQDKCMHLCAGVCVCVCPTLPMYQL